LAITIARRVLNREMATDPESILGLVKAAFQRCDARETYRLRVSPTDAEVVRENREPLRPSGRRDRLRRRLGARIGDFRDFARRTGRIGCDATRRNQRGFADVLAMRRGQ